MVIRYDDCGATVVQITVTGPGGWPRSGTAYNYGVGPAHYPVPTLVHDVWYGKRYVHVVGCPDEYGCLEVLADWRN